MLLSAVMFVATTENSAVTMFECYASSHISKSIILLAFHCMKNSIIYDGNLCLRATYTIYILLYLYILVFSIELR